MEIKITNTFENWKFFQNYIAKSSNSSSNQLFYFFRNILIWAVLGAVFFYILDGKFTPHRPTMIFMGVIFLIIVLIFTVNIISNQKKYIPIDKGIYLGTHLYRFDSQGIKIKGKHYSSSYNWPAILKVEDTKGAILIFLDNAYACVLPKDQLDNPEQTYLFVQKLYTENQQ